MSADRIHRLKLQTADWLRTGSFPGVRAGTQFLKTRMVADESKKLLASSNYLMHRPNSSMSKWALCSAKKEALSIQRKLSSQDKVTLNRSMVVKPRVSKNEPGAILVSFESELGRILSLKRFDKLQTDYRLLFMPSWQNFFSPEAVRLDVTATEPYYILPSAFEENRLRPMLGEHCRFMHFHAASWVNHHFFDGPPVNKNIDLLMLANFSPYKRHWRLFKALRDMAPNLKVRLIGTPLKKEDVDRVISEAKAFGVHDRIEILQNVDDMTLLDSLKRARLLCAMSHREGSYIAVPEAIMANTAVAMLSNAVIGTKAYVNDETGFLLDPRKPLALQLTEALAKSDRLSPQAWAQEHISAQQNCIKLNERLEQDFHQDGLDWTENVRPFYSKRFDFYHEEPISDAEAGVSEDYERLSRDFGLEIKRPASVPMMNAT